MTITDMLASQAPCASGGVDTPDALANVNDLSADRNSAYGLWEWLDTDTSGADDYADVIDLGLADLYDALVVFSDAIYTENGVPVAGRNRHANEQYEIPVQGSDCIGRTSDWCGPGQICLADGKCHSGDVHGCNLRDWAYHVAALTGLVENDVVTTMIASPCVGRFDDSYAFDGGYRFD